MKTAPQSEVTVFHPSFLSWFLLEYPGMFVVFMILVLVNDGFDDIGSAALFGLSCLLPIALLGARGLSRFHTDAISPEGLHGRSFWGVRRVIRWKEIREVLAFRLIHLRFLRLFSEVDEQVTWISLFPACPQVFRREIQRLAPSDSPIRKFIA